MKWADERNVKPAPFVDVDGPYSLPPLQMIGRGLRGARNGGTDRCLIINVQDNIDNFERRLAFSDLDWLWAPDAVGPRPD